MNKWKVITRVGLSSTRLTNSFRSLATTYSWSVIHPELTIVIDEFTEEFRDVMQRAVDNAKDKR